MNTATTRDAEYMVAPKTLPNSTDPDDLVDETADAGTEEKEVDDSRGHDHAAGLGRAVKR